MLTKEQILAADDLKRERVEVPEWGGHLFVGTITGAARDEFETVIFEPNKSPRERLRNIRARLVALTAVDEEGNLLFSQEDVEALGKKSAGVLDRVFSVAQRLNGLSKEDAENLAKNSGPSPRGDSTSS